MSLVSIVTPVFNAHKYLPEVYESLCAQTHKNWEWLVVDDCSSDNSAAYLRSLQERDPRVRFFQNEKNSGPSISRNRGIDESEGEYIAFLDADDKWLPEKLQKQLAFMSAKLANFSCLSYSVIDEAGNFVKEVEVPVLVGAKDLEAYNPLATSFIMVNKDALDGLRFDPTLKRRQDWVFWYEFARRGHNCYSLNEVLGCYRKDSIHSISKNKFHMAYLQWNLYRERFHHSFLKSTVSFIRYALHGLKKHYLK